MRAFLAVSVAPHAAARLPRPSAAVLSCLAEDESSVGSRVVAGRSDGEASVRSRVGAGRGEGELSVRSRVVAGRSDGETAVDRVDESADGWVAFAGRDELDIL